MVPVVTYLIFLLTCRPWGFFPLHLDLIFLLHYVLEYVIQFSFPCLPCSLLISGVKHFKGTLINLNFKNTFGFKKIEWEVLLHIFSLLSPTLLISLYCLYIVLVWYICCNWWINNDILLSIHFIVYGSVHFFCVLIHACHVSIGSLLCIALHTLCLTPSSWHLLVN